MRYTYWLYVNRNLMIKSIIGSANLKVRVVNIGEAQNTDIDNCLLVRFILAQDNFKAINSRTSLCYNLSKDVDIDLSRVEDVSVIDKPDKPSLDLRVKRE